MSSRHLARLRARSTRKQLWGASASDIWTVGARGVALRFNGTSWKQLATGTTQRLRGIWGRSATQVWIVGDAGTILYWNGLSFTAQASGTTESLAGVWGDSSVVWAVGERGTLLKLSGGVRSKATLGTTSGLYAIWGSAANDVWAVGEAGMVCRFGGISWTCGREFPMTSTALALTGTSRTNIWAFGTMSDAWHWNGATWTAGTVPGCTGGIAAIHGTSATNMYMVSDAAGDSVYRWDGAKFTTVTTGSMAGKTAVYAVGTRTFVTTAGGEVLIGNSGIWGTSLSLTNPLGYIAGFAADKVWVGGSASSYVLSYKP